MGDRIEGKKARWRKWYAGEVVEVNDDDTYEVDFDDGEHHQVKNS